MAGLVAFKARRANKSGVYSYEKRPKELTELSAKGQLVPQFSKWRTTSSSGDR
jgi:hypothetical protein